MRRLKILLADDEASWIEDIWRNDLNRLNIPDLDIHSRIYADELRETLKKNIYDILLLDMDWSKGRGTPDEGIDILHLAKQTNPNIEVIIITAKGPGERYERIRTAYKYGAADFLEKGASEYHKAEFERIIRNAVEKARLRHKANAYFWDRFIDESNISTENTLGNLIGQSEVMRGLFSVIKKVAKTESRVLLLGETGVGKSELARTIHNESMRSSRVLVEFTPGEFPETLQESELFGHVKGAFTGALTDKDGLITQAHGGTLFIDEVGTMMPSMQAQLLRFLDTQKVRKLGGKQVESPDVRLICATNRNIHKDALEGKFRSDLLMRISGFPLHIPPLRDHPEDVPLLSEKFLKKHTKHAVAGKAFKLTDDALDKLMRHDWPGNIRELKNIIERAVIMAISSDSNQIKAAHIWFDKEVIPATDGNSGVAALVNIDKLYSLIKNGEMQYNDMASLTKAWGGLIAREIVSRAMTESKGNMKQSGILLKFYEGIKKKKKKEDSPSDYDKNAAYRRDHKKYSAYRQYLTTTFKIRAKDHK